MIGISPSLTKPDTVDFGAWKKLNKKQEYKYLLVEHNLCFDIILQNKGYYVQ